MGAGAGMIRKRLDSLLSQTWFRAIVVLLLLAVAGGLLVGGLNYRRQKWEDTGRIRYAGDVYHGYGWGQIGRKVNLFAVYDLYAAGQIGAIPNGLDYTPLRLMMVTGWAHYAAV